MLRSDVFQVHRAAPVSNIQSHNAYNNKRTIIMLAPHTCVA